MVSAGHSLAAATALHVLQQGGNGIDAGLAASAVQCVVELPWCGLGGDAFWLIYTPSDGVVAFNGSGSAPRELRAEVIPGPKVPRIGALSVAVPGLVSSWAGVAARFASRPLATLLWALGHTVAQGVELGEQADPFGNCTVIAQRGGTFQGAADARRDALAIGL
jgi:gamma-glutamyltranspeptidase/glutathione hydrolase